MTQDLHQPEDAEHIRHRSQQWAARLTPPIPEAAAVRAAESVARLDQGFRAAAARIPDSELMWDGPDAGPSASDESCGELYNHPEEATS